MLRHRRAADSSRAASSKPRQPTWISSGDMTSYASRSRQAPRSSARSSDTKPTSSRGAQSKKSQSGSSSGKGSSARQSGAGSAGAAGGAGKASSNRGASSSQAPSSSTNSYSYSQSVLSSLGTTSAAPQPTTTTTSLSGGRSSSGLSGGAIAGIVVGSVVGAALLAALAYLLYRTCAGGRKSAPRNAAAAAAAPPPPAPPPASVAPEAEVPVTAPTSYAPTTASYPMNVTYPNYAGYGAGDGHALPVTYADASAPVAPPTVAANAPGAYTAGAFATDPHQRMSVGSPYGGAEFAPQPLGPTHDEGMGAPPGHGDAVTSDGVVKAPPPAPPAPAAAPAAAGTPAAPLQVSKTTRDMASAVVLGRPVERNTYAVDDYGDDKVDTIYGAYGAEDDEWPDAPPVRLDRIRRHHRLEEAQSSASEAGPYRP